MTPYQPVLPFLDELTRPAYPPGLTIRLNNDHTAFYARLLTLREPTLEGYLLTRRGQ